MLEVELRFISAGGGNVLCSTKIVSIMPAGTRMSDGMMRTAKKTKRFLPLTNGKKARSYILLDNGLIVSSRLRASTLYKRLNNFVPDPTGKQYEQDNKREQYEFEEDREPNDVDDDVETVVGDDPEADEFEDDNEEEEDAGEEEE